jgi:hypothetical protein
MDSAAMNGHLHTVQWLRSNSTEGCSDACMGYAAENGHLHVMRWLYAHHQKYCCDKDAMQLAMRNAAEAGHVHVMRWIHARGFGFDGLDLGLAIKDAAKNGHHHAVHWLFDSFFRRQEDILLFMEYAIRSAINNGHPHIARWLLRSTFAALTEIDQERRKKREQTTMSALTAVFNHVARWFGQILSYAS